MTILYLEPFSGISGDMLLGALSCLTDEDDIILSLPSLLNLPNCEVQISRMKKCGIACRKIDIIPGDNQHFRNLGSINKMLDGAKLDETVRNLAKKAFNILGEAESAIHQVPLEEVHFHEVGAVDTILDIVGCAVLFSRLNIEKVYSLPICTGTGTVSCAHGIQPVPAPATALLLKDMPIYTGNIHAELTTPTGAALLKVLEPSFLQPKLNLTKIGYGAGSKDFEHPNVLRVSLGDIWMSNDNISSEIKSSYQEELIWIIQCNIDDMPGQQLGNHFQQQLLSNGALDISIIHTTMKKGRPGLTLEILCMKEHLNDLIDLLLLQTTTLGVRYFSAFRSILPREIKSIDTTWGPVKMKCATLPDGQIKWNPEFEDCQRCASNNNISINRVIKEVNKNFMEGEVL